MSIELHDNQVRVKLNIFHWLLYRNARLNRFKVKQKIYHGEITWVFFYYSLAGPFINTFIDFISVESYFFIVKTFFLFRWIFS